MSTAGLLTLTMLAFAVGTSFFWIQARRRVRQRMLDQLVAEAEKRIRAEVLARAAGHTREQLAKRQAFKNPSATGAHRAR